ncbi:hypothetical protein PR202_gb21188 [Eleusine coracana subsp. coracana]|uniref:non-specific serine/threonine protein kinase n=1 Tax=Eleusine coracana subsp. coracana TaxID=191504 RepID=A0AAV5FAJ1_ELECO|nr:hypothetical protein PR202_gb21188 [Eleusine coracana subsp. coracana]
MGKDELAGGKARCRSMASPSPHHQLLFFLLLAACLCSAAAAATTDTLLQGGSLSPGETLVSSPSGVFELGFFAPDQKQPSRRHLGIWYHAMAPQTVVWVANRAAPATSPSPSLSVTDRGELRVLDGPANATAPLLWSSNTTALRGNYSAVIDDTGSLKVRAAGGGDDEVLWDSFAHPGDTMLPGMKIALRTPGKGPKEQMLFTSWASETDPSPGRYALGIDPNGSGQAYIWEDGTAKFWRFVVLPNGIDICYMAKKSSQEWETVWAQPLNECEHYATCGANAKCTAAPDGKAKCTCLKGFQPKILDQWNAGNWSQGCIRGPPLGCQSIRFDDDVEDGKSHELKVYPLDWIKAATCNFSDSNKLGAGGFGPVYLGKLSGGEEVAVKRLCRNSGQGLEEFKNEVILIAKLQHRNLAWRQWNEDKGIELIDPSIRESCSVRQVLRCIHIALLCVQDHADDRPDIPAVILMLSSDNLNLPNPRPPTLMLRGRDAETRSDQAEEESQVQMSQAQMSPLTIFASHLYDGLYQWSHV